MEWNLDSYYLGCSDSKFLNDLEYIESYRTVFENVVSNLECEVQSISNYIESISSFFSTYSRLRSYVDLRISTNNNDNEAQKFEERILNSYNNLVDLIEISEGKLCSFKNLDVILEDSELSKFKYYVSEIKKSRAHKLSPNEEQIISLLSSTGSKSWSQYKNSIISNMKVNFNGEDLPLTTILTYARNASREVRKQAYEAEIASYKGYEEGINAALNAIKGEVLTISKLRGYDSPLDMTVNETRINYKILDSLISAIEKSLPAFRKYFIAKANYLGNDKMHWYDMYAPVVEDSKEIPYSRGKEIVLEAFNSYSTKLHDFAKYAMNNNWIDVYPKEGKISGAFCSSCHLIKESRILLNYGNSIGDVKTLAHELGHAYHSLCLRDEHVLNTKYPMVLAETASNFCEIITKKHLLSISDEKTRLAILEAEISDTAQVIVDIYSRFIFEKSFFEKRKEGVLSVEETKNLMLDAQKKAYGESFDENYLHPYMWTWKPHYYYASSNFYNFPYAFGALFSKGLYSNYLNDKDSFYDKYDQLLQATGSNDVADVAKRANIDVETEEFWDNALNIVSNYIEEFVKLINK